LHELSVTKHILEIVLDELKATDYKEVKRIDIVIGDLSGLESESIEYYFKLLSEGTPVWGAILTFKHEKSKFRCNGCGKIYERCDFPMLCPHCKGRGAMIESSTSFYIESIEVE
jgi:hydrogenase nickel incorporation protein HypA/HybF